MGKRDLQVHEAVESALQDVMELSILDINVRVKEGIVYLEGIVDVLAEKETAGEIVRRVSGVADLQNDLTVATEGHVDDEAVSEEIEHRLVDALGEILKELQVQVHRGTVQLLGTVESLADKHRALAIARTVRGVKSVHSMLEIRKTGRDDDASITNRVETALSGEDLVYVNNVHTSTKNRVVTLKGQVNTPEEIAIAWQVAASVPGVKAVNNQLRAREAGQDEDKASNDIFVTTY